MENPTTVKFLRSAFQVIPAFHTKADMIEAYPVLIEVVTLNRPGRIIPLIISL
jgi:hypothetical protein